MKVRVIFLFLFILFPLTLAAQQPQAVVPFRLTGNKMIVDVTVNGELYPMVFDTGAQTSITDILCEQAGLNVVSSQMVTDANGNRGRYERVLIGALGTRDGSLSFSDVEAIKMPATAVECFGAAGLIGSDLLKGYIIEIDCRSLTISFYTPDSRPAVSPRNGVRFAMDSHMPIIPVNIGGSEINVLLDSGSGSGISLRPDDFATLSRNGAARVVAEGYGLGAMGLSGVQEADSVKRVALETLAIGPARFTGIVTTISNPPYTLMGLQFLLHGKVVIDYPRQVLYYIPHNNPTDMHRNLRDINFAVIGGDLVVASVFGDMREVVEVGDKVLKINGRKAGKYDFCDSIIKGIPEMAQEKITLTIKTKHGTKEINYDKLK